jgi:hypothetical protein
MYIINAQIKHNYDTFDSDTGREHVMVESFDNREFEVYRGTMNNMVKLGVITAETDADLSKQLNELANKRD